jgi:hypothetical protein
MFSDFDVNRSRKYLPELPWPHETLQQFNNDKDRRETGDGDTINSPPMISYRCPSSGVWLRSS